MIYLTYYKDTKKAQTAFAQLISDHPESPYAEKAKAHYAQTEKQEKPKKK